MNLSYFEIWICSLEFRQNSRKNQRNFSLMGAICVSTCRYFIDASAELPDVATFETKSMIVWNQAEWLFGMTHLRYSANLVITSTISTYDTLFSLSLQRWKTKSVLTITFSMLLHSGSLRHHSNRNWLKCLFSWSEFKYSIFVPETKLVFNPRFVRIVKILLIKVKMSTSLNKFCRWKFMTESILRVTSIPSASPTLIRYDFRTPGIIETILTDKNKHFYHSSPRELKLPMYLELWGQRLLRCPSNCIQSNRTRYLAC